MLRSAATAPETPSPSTQTSLIGDFTYDLRVPAAFYSDGLTVLQDFPSCPVQCSLTLANGDAIPPEFGVADPGIFPVLEILDRQ